MPSSKGQPSYEAGKARQRELHAALKAAGGPEYEAWKEKKRQQKAASRERHGRQVYDGRSAGSMSVRRRQGLMLKQARKRAGLLGREFALTWEDVEWVEVCPALGLRLDYACGGKNPLPHSASLDRRDNRKGYVPGNVFVISMRANAIKGGQTAEELLERAAVMKSRATVEELRLVAAYCAA